ncbi:MAG TPA: copper resistance protein CopC [Rhodopila sp.]|nr:copper resistance protein CopC [Rhodopila sp.]
MTTAAITIAAVTIFPGPAQAHAILEDSSPKAGGSVHAGTIDLQFRYNSRVDQGRSRLVLIRPDHKQTPVPIAPGSPPDIIRSHLDLKPGAYVIRWQVLAVDGHITRGDVPFTVTGP